MSMRQAFVIVALSYAMLALAAVSEAATTREEASELIRRYYERHRPGPTPLPAAPATQQGPTAPAPAATQCNDLFFQAIERARSGDQRNAIRLYTELLKLCPRICPAMNNMGVAYNTLGDRNRAKVWFEAATRCDPKNPHYKANAAMTAAPQPPQVSSPPSPTVKPASAFDGAYVGATEYQGRRTGIITLTVSGSRIALVSENDPRRREFVGAVRSSGDFVIEFPNNTYSGRIVGRSISGTWRLHKGVLGGPGTSGTFRASR
jgi:hypothetical protein